MHVDVLVSIFIYIEISEIALSTIGQFKYYLERGVSGIVSWDMLILFEGHKLLIKVEDKDK